MYAISEEVDDTGSFVFVGHAEGVGVVYFASGPIQEFAADGNKLEFMVDETPTTSVIRIVMIVGDRRQYERQYGSVAMFTTEFEVVR